MRTFFGTLQARLFWAFTLVTLIAVALPAYFSRNIVYQDRVDLAARQAQAQALVLKSVLEADADARQIDALLAAMKASGVRMTIADKDGQVAADSHVSGAALADLDNHNDRPEIESARSGGEGVALRYSNTLGIEAVYAAVPLGGGRVLRLAVPLASVRRTLEKELSTLSMSLVGVVVLCLLLSVVITRRFRGGIDSMAEIVAAIARNKGGRRLLNVPGREFLPLACAVNRMAENIEEYVATSTDQQTQLEVILDSLHEGVVVLGPTGSIRRCNRAMQALFPATAGALGRQLIEAVPVPALQRQVETLLEESAAEKNSAMQSGTAVQTGTAVQAAQTGEAFQAEHGSETVHSGHDGAAVHFEQNGRFLVAHISRPVERNHSLGAVIVIYDATHIMRLERVRRDFVANVSHELRTPLTAITGYAETLASLDELSPVHRNFAGIIHKHALTLARVISDLLSLARIEDMRERISLARTNPDAPLDEAIRMCREQAEQKGLRFTVEGDPNPQVMGNASLLTQVFRNLLENACRYSPEGGEIVISRTAQGKDMLFSIKDQGPGIPAEELSRIFERLYQVKKQRNSGSSGIGLAICKHIIERHGGAIWAESPCQGFATAMLFTLPLAATDRTAAS